MKKVMGPRRRMRFIFVQAVNGDNKFDFVVSRCSRAKVKREFRKKHGLPRNARLVCEARYVSEEEASLWLFLNKNGLMCYIEETLEFVSRVAVHPIAMIR